MNDNEIIELSLGTADVQSITGDIVTGYILQKRDSKIVLSQLFKKVQVPEGFRQAKTPTVPTATLNVNTNVGEGSTLTVSSYSYNSNTILPRKMGLYLPISKEAWEQPSRPILKELLAEMGTELAKHQDLRAFTVTLDIRTGTLTESDFSGGTLADSPNQPFIAIDSAVFNTGSISYVDYGDGKVLTSASITTGTVTYRYSNRCKATGFYTNVTNAQTLTVRDILKMRGTLCSNSLHPDIVLVNDIDFPNLVYDASANGLFLATRTYANGEGVLNGELGMLVDLRVLSSVLVPEGVAVVCDSDRLGFNVVKRDLWSTVQDYPSYDQKRVRAWIENDFAYADTLALGLVTNFKSGQYPAGDL